MEVTEALLSVIEALPDTNAVTLMLALVLCRRGGNCDAIDATNSGTANLCC